MLRMLFYITLFFTLAGQSSAGAPRNDTVVATVEGHGITMSEVDEAGGRNIHDVAHELYTARVQALYSLLSERLMTLEASARDITLEELRQVEITDKTLPVNDVDIDSFIAEQSNLDGVDPRVRNRVSLFLKMKARSDRKKRYMAGLFRKYDVQVELSAPPAPPPEKILGDVPPSLGKPDALVKIVSFSDYQCPYCRQMSATLYELLKRFPDDVQIVYRHFPVQDDSQKLAEAALCAGDQNRFWDYHTALFNKIGVNSAHIGAIADELGLNRARFDHCIENRRHTAQVQNDIKEGKRLQISGTPTNFINGVRIRGAAKLNTLIPKIQAFLAEKRNNKSAASNRPYVSDDDQEG